MSRFYNLDKHVSENVGGREIIT